MKKKLFTLTMILGFILGSAAFAWQDPCLIIENEYICNEYSLVDWEPIGPLFSPAPRCEGTVTLLSPDSTWISLDYISNGDRLLIAGIPCRLNNKGNLVCKIITQPEISEILIFEERNDN